MKHTAQEIAESVYGWRPDGSHLKKRKDLADKINQHTAHHIKEHLSRAAENVKAYVEDPAGEPYAIVVRDSIRNIEIKLS